MILQIDAGNTRVKWRLKDPEDNSSRCDQACSVVIKGDFESELRSLVGKVTEVQLSSVSNQEKLLELFNKYFSGIPVFVAATQVEQLGLENSYVQPDRMGVDRWLAMLAAWNHYKSGLIVVDAGTALTIDVVDDSGKHQGGYILPGYAMAISSLKVSTSEVRHQMLEEDAISLGKETSECVQHGVVRQMVEVIKAVQADYAKFHLVLSGGDAEMLAPYFQQKDMWPNLVHDGLSLSAAVS